MLAAICDRRGIAVEGEVAAGSASSPTLAHSGKPGLSGTSDGEARLVTGVGERDKVGRLRGECRGVGWSAEGGVPAVEVAGELVEEHAGTDLQQEVGAAWCPAHLLLLDHAFGDDLVDRGLGECSGDGLTRAVGG
jgi:hypothetical protein